MESTPVPVPDSNQTLIHAMPNRILLPLLIPFLFAAACDTSPTAGVPAIVFPDRNVSYSAHVQPLFDASCATSGCHDEFTQAGALQLRTYFDLFRQPGIVRGGDSLNSVMSQILSNRIPHISAPITLLTNLNQRNGVSVWIQEGALNN